MATNKFLTLINGIKTLVTGINSSTGVGDADKIIATNAAGEIDSSFLPAGVEIQTESIVTSEDLLAGDFVNIYDNTGTPTARKAIGTSYATRAMGFVLAGVTAPASATVYTKGVNSQVSGFTAGNTVFLSTTTGGDATETAPTETTGNITQYLGYVITPTRVLFEYDDPIEFG